MYITDPAAVMRDEAYRVGSPSGPSSGAWVSWRPPARDGRQNKYAVHRRRPLRHPMGAHVTAGELIDLASPRSA
ncbi:MAG TPA: hypothetical protein VKD90_04855 [Gemmataceae bacterium]|nr:hypothetical protein [Gemmataceae bacterium]